MDRRTLTLSVTVILIASLFLGAGTFAYFSDTEMSTGNVFTAGTLDLKVGGQDDPYVVHVTLPNMKPGDNTGYYKWVLKNAGTLPGKLSVTFSVIINDDNFCNEPEEVAGDTTPGDADGKGEGELGQYLIPWIGFGPPTDWKKGWSDPYTGPSYGLNTLVGGKTFGTLYYLPGDVLNPGQEVGFFFKLTLDSNLLNWTYGGKWTKTDVDDNIIQSDSVEFDIIFHLDQVP